MASSAGQRTEMFSDSKLTTLMKDILFRDYVDVSLLNAPNRCRRVITPDSLAAFAPSKCPRSGPAGGNSPSFPEYEAACAFIGHEMDLTYTDIPDPTDMSLTELWFCKWASLDRAKSAMREVFGGLVFRFLIQERILIVAEDLISRGLISIESMYTPMSLRGNFAPSHSVQIILDVLECFTLGHDCLDHVIDSTGRPFATAATWLAVLVARSCTDWQGVLLRWIAFYGLGEPDVDSWTDLLRRDLRITIDPEDAIFDSKELTMADVQFPQVGFWLPHGMTIKDFVEPWSARHTEMKRLYQAIFDESWPGGSEAEFAVAKLLNMEAAARTIESGHSLGGVER